MKKKTGFPLRNARDEATNRLFTIWVLPKLRYICVCSRPLAYLLACMRAAAPNTFIGPLPSLPSIGMPAVYPSF